MKRTGMLSAMAISFQKILSKFREQHGYCLVVFLVGPLITGHAVRFVRHGGRQATLRELGLERLADPRILVRVLDLIAGEVVDFLSHPRQVAWRVEREVPCLLLAQVEVLMEPAVRGDEDAPLV